MQVRYPDYLDQEFTCSECGWKGIGKELEQAHFSEIHCIMDLGCPKCDNLIAYWQAPLIDDIDKK